MPDVQLGGAPRQQSSSLTLSRPLVILIGIAACLGTAILLAPAEHMYGPGPPHAGGIGEELDRGNIAYEIIHGPLLDLLDYQWATFFGGSLVMGIAAVPFFRLLGPNLFALKLVPLLFHLGTLSLVILLLNRFVSRRAAWLGGLLMVFCPPGYALMTTICFGTHVEQNLFAVASLGVCLWILLERRRDPLVWLGWGCLAGFGTYFSYTFLVVVALCWAFTVVPTLRREVGSTKCVASYVVGFLIGLAPWLLYNFRFNFAGIRIYDKPFSSHFSASTMPQRLFDSLLHVVFVAWPDSLWFHRPGGLGFTVSRVYALCIVTLVALALWRYRGSIVRSASGHADANSGHRTVRMLLGYIVLYVGLLSSSAFVAVLGNPPSGPVSTYRYLMPTYPYVLMLAGVGLDALYGHSKAGRYACVTIVALLCTTSFIGTMRGYDGARFGILLQRPAYSIAGLGEWFVRRFPGDLHRLQLVVDGAAERRTAAYQQELYRSMGSLLDRFFRPEGPRVPYDREHLDDYRVAGRFLEQRVAPQYRGHFVRRDSASRGSDDVPIHGRDPLSGAIP